MSDYRSAYERYYKNINNTAKGKKERNNYLSLGSINDRNTNSRFGIGEGINNKPGHYLVRRIIRELIGSTLLLVIFFGMKVIPLTQVNEAYNLSKQVLSEPFDYDECIETFSDVTIGDFKVEDIKSNNIKAKVSQFMDYLKNVSQTQLKTGL